MRGKKWWCAGVALLLAACASQPPPVGDTPAPRKSPLGGGYYLDDGPGDDPPSNIDDIADAIPRWEPLHRGAARPYTVLGRSYAPMTELKPYKARGTASWYGRKFHGQRTSNGEVYDMYAMTAAHPTLPVPSYARVSNLRNGKAAVVRVNDRGPFLHDRLIDLSYAAARRLGFADSGSAAVEVELIVPGEDMLAQAKPVPVRPPEMTSLQADEANDRVADRSDPIAEILAAQDADVAGLVPAVAESRGLFLQLGAFSSSDNAENLRLRLVRQLADLAEKLKIHAKDGMYRLQLGPYRDAQEARSIARRVAESLELRPFVIRRNGTRD